MFVAKAVSRKVLLDEAIDGLLRLLSPSEVIMPTVEAVVEKQAAYAASMYNEFVKDKK